MLCTRPHHYNLVHIRCLELRSASNQKVFCLFGYTDAQPVEISLAIAVTVFTNVFNRINDTTVDFPLVV